MARDSAWVSLLKKASRCKAVNLLDKGVMSATARAVLMVEPEPSKLSIKVAGFASNGLGHPRSTVLASVDRPLA
jgi:hypothetical protein